MYVCFKSQLGKIHLPTVNIADVDVPVRTDPVKKPWGYV